MKSDSFLLSHSRGGVVSLCLSENDDDDEFKLDPNYHNVEFLITTGPGPCPQLDSKNIVFGTVLEGTNSKLSLINSCYIKILISRVSYNFCSLDYHSFRSFNLVSD